MNTDTSQPIALVHGSARGSVTLPGYGAVHIAVAAP